MKFSQLIRKSIYSIFLLIVLLQSSCSNIEVKNDTKTVSSVLILDYKDFGPSQLSEPFLGKNFWQWQESREHSPVQYDIKVAVYKNITLEAAQKLYPTIPENKQDYRYVEYSKTIIWLDAQILKNQQELRTIVQSEQLDLILYNFSRLENMYKLLINIERGLK